MPALDVSDVLFDPDFLDSMTYTRNYQTVGVNGLGVITATTLPFFGVVTSDGGQKLNRTGSGEGEFMSQTIMVITNTRLDDGGTDGAGDPYTADIVTWNGQQYTVVNIDDYSRYGKGFVQARCELISVTS